MAKIYMEKLHFQPKRKTLAQWQKGNPVLCEGEAGAVTDGTETEWLKIGDGVTAWNDLPFKKGPKGDRGERGIKGDKGDKGDPGEVTAAELKEVSDKLNNVSKETNYNSDKLLEKMDRFDEVNGTSVTVPAGTHFIPDSRGGGIGFGTNGNANVSSPTGADIGGAGVNMQFRNGKITVEDWNTLSGHEPVDFTGIKTPDGSDGNAAVNVEYVDNILGAVNEMLAELVSPEETL